MFYDRCKPHNVSVIMRHYIGSVLATMRDFSLLYAPFVNAYRRFVAGSFAATSVTGSIDNRPTGLRVVTDHAVGCQIVNRMSDADTNPYHAILVYLLDGLHGIENVNESGEPHIGIAYDDASVPFVPRTFEEAIDLFDRSEVGRSIFGDHFVDAYLTVKEYERELFRKTVTDREVRRYLDHL